MGQLYSFKVFSIAEASGVSSQWRFVIQQLDFLFPSSINIMGSFSPSPILFLRCGYCLMSGKILNLYTFLVTFFLITMFSFKYLSKLK